MNFTDIIEGLSDKIMDYKMEELKKVASDDVNFALLQYIFAIGDMDNPVFSDLAEKLSVSKPAVTASVNKLISSGIVLKRQSSEDKRIYYLSLSERGEELYNVCKLALIKLEKDVTSRLTEEEYHLLMKLLTKIVD